MKNLCKILFLFLLINSGGILSAKNKNSLINYKENIKTGITHNILSHLVLPTATILGTTSVCQNATNPQITFTGSGGTAPYTFTYKINGGASLTATTTGSNTSISIPVNTSNAGIFTYNLISIHDTTIPITEITSPGTATVTVSSPPIINFTFTNDNSCSGTPIQFSSNVTGSSTYTYLWDFGDGTTSTQQNPSHAFSSLGCATATFNVTLTVTGGGCTVTKTNTITVKQKPDISFSDQVNPFNPFNNCSNASSNPVYSITVGNTSASSCITSFSIDWGDGNTQANITFPISHTYTSNGVYAMIITANGTNGCVNSKTCIVKNVSNPLGGLNSPGTTQNLCAPTTNLQFTLSNWGGNSLDTTYKINYNDGSPIVVLTQSELNSSPYYNVSDPLKSDKYPIPHIYTTSSCPAPSFEVKLEITNACGVTPLSVGNITILTKPNADFTVPSNGNGCVNNSILFTNTTVSGYGQNCVQGSIYTWDFGDSTPIITTPLSAPQNMNHTYSSPGTYDVTLTAQNECGTTTTKKIKQICIEPPLTPSFTINNTSGCAPLAITTTNTTVTTNYCTPTTYIWNVVYTPAYCGTSIAAIPDQTTTNASFNFTEPGTYTIKLTATNLCGSFSTSQIVTVKKPPTITSINGILPNYCGTTNIAPTATINSCAPASSTVTYSWSFLGGIPSSSTLANPGSINYPPSATPYTVSLTISNECGSSTTATKSFTVKDIPVLTNTSLDQTICSGSSTTLINLTSSPAGATFSWTATATPGISGFIPSGTNTIPIQTISTTNLSSGTIIYAITPSLGGCLGTTTNYVITVNPAPFISSQPVSSSVCLGGTPSVLSVTVSGAIGTPTYQWYANAANNTTSGTIIPGETNATYTPPAGAVGTTYYYCVITLSSGGCSSITSNTATITINPQQTIAIQPLTPQTLCVGGTIPLNIAFSGGAGTASYQWYSNTSNSNSGGTLISGATSATYTPPAFSIPGNYYYYAILTLSGNGCGSIISDAFEIVIVADPTVTQPLTSQTICQNASPTPLSVTANGGIGVYTYQWYKTPSPTNIGGSPVVGSNSSSYTPPTDVVGTFYYYCLVSQTGLGCDAKSNTATVVVNLSPTITSQPVSSTICIGQTPTLLNINYINGVGTPQYQWYSNTTNTITGSSAIPGATSATFNPPNSAIGTLYYYCIITLPTGGCSSLTSNIAVVTINPYPVISNKSVTICSGNPFSITPDTLGGDIVPINTTYTWTNPTLVPTGAILGASAQTAPQTTISQTLINTTTSPVTITYTVTPKSGACTGANFTITVTVNPAISLNITSTNSSCFGVNNGAIQTNITGGIPFSSGIPYVVSWIGPGGFSSSASNISNLAPGNYTLSVTDAGGCPINKTYLITEPNDIVITTNLKKDITCFNAANGEIKITISGGTLNYKINWTKNGTAYATTKDLSNLSPGNYTVTVSDANNCAPKTASFTITEPLLLAVNLVNKTDVLCYGQPSGAITVAITGGTAPYTFAWTGPNGLTSSNQNLTAVFAGNYNLIVTDNLGCSKNLSVQITQTPEISIRATTTPIICYGDNNASIDIVVSGGIAPYQILWSNLGRGTFQDNLSAGNYTITVTDALSCTKKLDVNIPEAPIFTISPVVKNISCFGAKNGSINLNITGGVAPVKLTWNDSSVTGTTRNNLSPGTYTVTITDGKPCTITKTFTLLEPQLLVLSANTTHALDCNNANSGAINLLVSGGSAPFTYLWSNGATTEDLSNIPAGNYLVTVTDSNGCSKQAQYSINRPPPLVTKVATKTDFNCETKSVKQTFVAQVSGGVPPYQLAWSSGTISGVNNEMMNTSQNGTVILYATDAIGCKSNYTFNVDIPVLGTPSFNASSFGYTTYGAYSINDPIQFTNTATGNFVSVAWDFGDGIFSAEPNPVHTFVNPKEYIVTQTVTYPFGCVYVQKITFIVGKGYLLVVPNAFTPNNDTFNDTFRPVTKALKNVHLDVYDTWGSLIYSETGDILRGWNGKIKDSNAENGNYFCRVSGETFYGTIVNENHPFVLIK